MQKSDCVYSKISSTGSALPARRVTNAELAGMLAASGIETSDEWIRSRTGITARYLAESETTLSLATEASEKALKALPEERRSIDLVIAATTTPDELFPALACRLQAELGLPPCPAFDVQAVCSGFVYALATADAMIRAGNARRVLVAGAETFSRLLDWNDRTSCVLFGDGAGALVLEASDTPGVLASSLSADGRLGNLLAVPGHFKNGSVEGSAFFRMDGRSVFREAVRVLTESAAETLGKAGLPASELDYYVPHQANIRIMEAAAKRLGVPRERMATTLFEHGNTCAASVPLALDKAVRSGRAVPGSTVLLQGVGGGMTWGSVLVRL